MPGEGRSETGSSASTSAAAVVAGSGAGHNLSSAEAKKELEKTARDDAPEFLRQLQTFVVENMLLASGFGGGLLLGLASS